MEDNKHSNKSLIIQLERERESERIYVKVIDFSLLHNVCACPSVKPSNSDRRKKGEIPLKLKDVENVKLMHGLCFLFFGMDVKGQKPFEGEKLNFLTLGFHYFYGGAESNASK